MILPDGPPLLAAALLLAPLALAARRKSRKSPPPSPKNKKKSEVPFWIMVVGLAVVGVAWLHDYCAAPRYPSRAPARSVGDFTADWEVAAVARICPRYAALLASDAGLLSNLDLMVANLECLSIMCEHPERAGLPAEMAPRRKPVCDAMLAEVQVPMSKLARPLRKSCPGVHAKWAERTWSPGNHLDLLRDLLACQAPACERASGRGSSESLCDGAAKLAKALGDAPAAARLQALATAAREQQQKEWEALPEEERKMRMDYAEKILAKPVAEACRKGDAKMCEVLEPYCRRKGWPQDLCPPPRGGMDGG